MLCKCLPMQYSFTGLIDQRVYLPYFFEKLAHHQVRGFRQVKAAAALKDKLKKADLGDIRALALRLADWLPSSVVHGPSHNHNRLFDPWSTTIAIASIALEARGCLTNKKAFTLLALAVITDHQLQGSSTSAGQSAAKGAEMMAYMKEQLHQLRGTDIDETPADKRARLARIQRARLKNTPSSVSESRQDHDSDGEESANSAGDSPSNPGEASDLPTASQVFRHLDELLCLSSPRDHTLRPLDKKTMYSHTRGEQGSASQADLGEEGEEVIGEIDDESVHGYSEEDVEDESDFV